MDLKAVFKETYDIHYDAAGEIDQRFAEDVGHVIKHLDDEFDGALRFSVAQGQAGDMESVVLKCEDVNDATRSATVRMSKDFIAEGQVLKIGEDNSELYDVSTAEGMDYACESIIKKVARDFAHADTKKEAAAAANRRFGL